MLRLWTIYFFETVNERQCYKCGFKMILPGEFDKQSIDKRRPYKTGGKYEISK